MPLKNSAGPVVGLDIGSNFIKACEVESRGGRASLRGIAVIPTPPEAVSNNEIVDPTALGKAIKQLLGQAGIKAKKTVTSVSGTSSLVVRIIEVPKMTRAELQETMKWEVERHVPFAAEQTVMDYQPLVSPEDVPDGQNMEVLLAVAQEAAVNRQVAAVQAAGLQPFAIDIEPLANSRSILDLSNGAGPQGVVAIVDMGATSTDISIYRDGRIAFTRSIQLAGNTLTKAICDVLGRPLADGERLKKELAMVPEQPQSAGDPNMFSAPMELDFGIPDADPLGGAMGGTYGMGPGASTATDTQAEPAVDIAGGGLSPEAFTGSPELAALAAGPVPAGNPFDLDTGPGAAPNPFEGGSPFGPVPGGDPFAPADPLAGFGSEAPTAFGIPAPMSEEDYLKTQIGDAIMPVLHEMATELRRSLDFFRNRANGLGAQQVVITGGTAKLPGLAPFLAANLETPVVVGNPLQYVTAGPKSDAQYLLDVGPFFAVSVGLAVRELMVETAPRPSKKKK